MTAGPAPVKAGRQEWIGLAVLALPCLLITMDLTVLFLAVPSLVADMSPSSSQLLWITDVYGFLLAGSLIVMGTLGDRIGRRRLILAGAAAFGVTSVFAAAASNPDMLILARALQGIAGATLLPTTMALVFTMFTDQQQRTAALGVVMASFGLGAVLGPLLGGAVLEFFDWSAVFLLNVPVMALLLVLGPRLLPEARGTSSTPIDFLSAALSVVAILLTIYGVKDLATDGASGVAIASVAGGLALGAAFVVRQLRVENPLVDVRMFGQRTFSTAFLATTVGIFTTYGMVYYTSQHLQLVEGLSPLEAGLWGLPPAFVMMIACAGVVPQLAKRIRPGYLMGGGLVVSAGGLLLLTQVDASDSAATLAFSMIPAVAGLAPAVTLGANLIIGTAPPERAGSASGLADAGNELAGALGIAILGTLGTAVYRSDMNGASSAARESLGGAVGLPRDAFDVATAAFSHGMHVAVAVGAVILLAVAAVSFAFLRGVPAAGPTAVPHVPHAPKADANVEPVAVAS